MFNLVCETCAGRIANGEHDGVDFGTVVGDLWENFNDNHEPCWACGCDTFGLTIFSIIEPEEDDE